MLRKEDLHVIAQHFSLDVVQNKPHPLEGGRINQQWVIKTSKGLFVIKQLNPQMTEEPNALKRYIQTEEIAKQFSKHVNVSSALFINDSPLCHSHHSVFMLYPYIEGKVLCQDTITTYYSECMASTLATMHQATISTQLIPEVTFFTIPTSDQINILKNQLIQNAPTIASQLNIIQPMLTSILDHYHDHVNFFQINCIASHCDLDVKNVIWNRHNQPTLIDWEYASTINQYVDLISTAVYWSMDSQYNINFRHFEIFLKTYTKKTGVRLSSTQLDFAFLGLITSWIGWLIFNLNRLIVNPLDSNEFKEGVHQSNNSFSAIPHIHQQKSSIIQHAFDIIHNT